MVPREGKCREKGGQRAWTRGQVEKALDSPCSVGSWEQWLFSTSVATRRRVVTESQNL